MIASVLRESMLRTRQPQMLTSTLALFSAFRARLIRNPNRTALTGMSKRCLMINNLAKCVRVFFPLLWVFWRFHRLPYASHHFGYPGRVLLYYWGYMENFIAMLPANPVKLSDGSWKTNEGGVDIMVGVKQSLKSDFLRLFRADMAKLSIKAYSRL